MAEIVSGARGTAHSGTDAVDINQYSDSPSPEPGYQPPPEWLGPIEARMADLQEQNYALAEQLQQQQGGYYADGDYDYDDDEEYDPSDEDWEALGIDPAELDQVEDDAQVEEDIVDLFDKAIDRRVGAMEAQDELADRDQGYEDLKLRYPFLQQEEYAYPIVKRAQRLAESLDPSVIDTVGFVDLVEAVAKASMVEQASGDVTWPQPQRQPQAVQLEAGHGATVHDRQPEQVDFQARIVAAAERMNPKI